ncbi:MAG: 6-carboxytetrahydropterin synthase QueD [Candidatus Margulisbacteria bacterium GWF2_35_9]|nr:MAG: 6-carboxytetrahydropterin synthase QueD [Candidatus Margulisbacteria bacterium GWF2_35_9]
MYKLSVEEKFSAAHQLTNYKGPCENLHGHTWKVRITVEGAELDQSGMLLDFRVLKSHLKKIHNEFDHTFLNNLVPFSPTSENLSKYIFEKMDKDLPKQVTLKEITVWESETSCATYYV